MQSLLHWRVGWKALLGLVALLMASACHRATPQTHAQNHAQPAAEETESVGSNLAELRHKAEAGNAVAQFNLGKCYDQGQGVPKDESEAVKWYRKAAEQGLAEAQCNLGLCYQFGDGIPESKDQAVKWYREAAEQNFALAQYALGICYHEGNGVPKSDVEAVKWFRGAAEQGNAKAQHNLGVSYCNGIGVPKDLVAAYRWLSLSATQGVEPARRLRDQMEQIMTPDQIADGQRLAREFQPKKAGADAPGLR